MAKKGLGVIMALALCVALLCMGAWAENGSVGYMLWHYAGEPESSQSLSGYADAESVSGWAEAAMAWAIEKGVVTGVTSTTLAPQATATRAQAATILMRFAEL